jgi:hypothetical protein
MALRLLLAFGALLGVTGLGRIGLRGLRALPFTVSRRGGLGLLGVHVLISALLGGVIGGLGVGLRRRRGFTPEEFGEVVSVHG